MSEQRHQLARFFGLLWPACYTIFAAVVGAIAIAKYREGNVQGAVGFAIPVVVALYMLYNSVTRWKQIADKHKPK